MGCSPFFFSRLLLFLVICSLLFTGIAHAGTETLLSVNASDSIQQAPAIWGDWVVWEDSRNGGGGGDIYSYNIVSGEERRISTSTYAFTPGIYGDIVVWQDRRTGTHSQHDIYFYNLTNMTENAITSDSSDQVAPAIYGTKIVWQQQQSTLKYDIMMYDISSGTLVNLTPDTIASDQKFPELSGNLVVWEDHRNKNNVPDIFLNDTSSTLFYNLTPGMISTSQYHPSISGSKVVWRDMRNAGSKGNIFMNDTASWITTEIDSMPATTTYMYHPSIFNNKIVWADSRARGTSNYDLYLKDLTTGQPESRITSDNASVVISNDVNGKPMGPAINGNRIVWTDKQGKRDIYLYTDDIATTCPVASFSPSVQMGSTPLTVTFTDTSAPNADSITHRKWEFGDGSTSTLTNSSYTYTVAGIYMVRLTVNNAACRNETPVSNSYNVSAGAPFATFTTNVSSGIVPVVVQFNDTSLGATVWNWSYGDGTPFDRITDSLQKNVTHSYGINGTYTAVLNASNEFGYSLKTTTITGLNGANVDSNPSITGINITSPHGPQLLTFDTDKISFKQYTKTALICTDEKLAGKGFQNVTFLSSDGIGFGQGFGSNITGNISSVILQTKKINTAGFSKATGEQSSVSYILTSPSYPTGGTINTQVWEGALSADLSTFSYIASKSNFNSLAGLAYTTKVTKTGFPSGTTVRINMSVNSSWIAQLTNNTYGRNHTYMIRISDNGETGEVLQARYLFNDTATNLDYFEFDSPHGASTFGLSLLSGTGNPLQLITLTVASYVNPQSYQATVNSGSDSESSNRGPESDKGTVVQDQNKPEIKAPIKPPDPGKTESLYTNTNGVITQLTTLKSNDNLASVVLEEGTVAKDSTGSPLSSISIASVAPASLPPNPAGQAVMIDGRAYELQPDGAVFSPGISVTFTIPQAQWGREYSLKMYDRTTGAWQEIPGSFNTKSGTFTAIISHFCIFALFEKEITPPAIHTAENTPTPGITMQAPADQPPSTAISIIFGMAEWVIDTAIQHTAFMTAISLISIVVLASMVLYRKRKGF